MVNAFCLQKNKEVCHFLQLFVNRMPNQTNNYIIDQLKKCHYIQIKYDIMSLIPLYYSVNYSVFKIGILIGWCFQRTKYNLLDV